MNSRLSDIPDDEFYDRIPEVFAKYPQILKKLSYIEREMIQLTVGWGHDQAYTRKEVATIFKVTQARVRHITTKAFTKIKSWVRAIEHSNENV